MSDEKKLIILNGKQRIGTLTESSDLYTFTYDDSWIESTESFDISPNIKRVIKIHSGSSIKNFLENLLPEDSIRRRIAEQNKTDDKNIIRLLEITGRDSAGALQVYRKIYL